MKTETTPTAASVADKAIDKVSDFVTAAASSATNIFEATSNIFVEAINKYGQSVVDAVLWVVRIDALQMLVIGWLMFVSAIVVFTVIYRGYAKHNWWTRCLKHDTEFPVALLSVVMSVVFLFIGGCGLSRVTNVWLYVGVAKPELYIAKQAIDVVKAKLNPPTQQNR